MTAAEPRSRLAAMPAARLAPAAEALAEAYAEAMSAAPPPEGERVMNGTICPDGSWNMHHTHEEHDKT